MRLEKAREHYLDRLKREWAEEGQLASRAPSDSSNAEEDMVSSNKLKKVINAEKEKLRIYFPNLRKASYRDLEGSLFFEICFNSSFCTIFNVPH